MTQTLKKQLYDGKKIMKARMGANLNLITNQLKYIIS